MSHNSLYPGFVKVFYTVSGLQHVQTLPVQPYEGVGGWWLSTKGSTVGSEFATAIATYQDVLKAVLSTTSSVIDFAELWVYDTPEGDPIFADTVTIGVSGTWAQTPNSMGQLVVSYRTEAGGVLKIYVMETPNPPNLILTPPTFGGTQNNLLRNWFTSGACWVCGRDGSFAISVIRGRTKTNDALRKKRQLFS